MSEFAILYDTSRCSGCHACQVACKVWNNLPSSLELNGNKWSGSHQNPPDLNGNTRLIMTYNEEENPLYGTASVNEPLATKSVLWAFGRRACQHCTDAACMDICPADAIYRSEFGMVTTDTNKCVGCQYCSAACPFDVPRYDMGSMATKLNKCTGCVDRIENGMAPACVTTCQPEALEFGERDEMIAKANERLKKIQELGYKDACIYGVEEMGGLHVIQILKYGIEAHGMVADPHKPALNTLIQYAKPVTGIVAPVVVVGLAAMFGLAHGYKRSKLAYNPETKDTIDVDTGEVVKHGDGQDERTLKEALTENLPFMKKNKEGDNE